MSALAATNRPPFISKKMTTPLLNKKIIYRAFWQIALCCTIFNALQAQLYIGTGATLTLNSTQTITVKDANWVNAGTLNMSSNAVIRLQGTQDQNVTTGGSTLQNLEIDKTAGQVYLQDNCTIATALSFINTGSRINLGGNDLLIGSTASITGYSSNAYVVTGSTGEMVKQGLSTTAFTYPVGSDAITYNPLTISENGISDNIGVRCLAAPLANGSSGTALTANAVNTAWEVTEGTTGGSSLGATAQWAATDELPDFVRTDCGLARFNTGTDWDLPPTNMGSSTGSDPYTRSRTSLTPGIWMVGDEFFMNRVLVSAKIMLQGAYSTTTHKMSDNLRSLAAFPLTAPTTYGTGKFVQSGWQPAGGYTIDASVLSVTGDNAIVDWVFLWFKDPTSTSTNLQTRPALLQKDGDIVELNGIDPVKMPGNATQNYILGVGHRNHLSVRTPNGSGINFSESATTAYDFTTATTQAYGTNPMKLVDTSPTNIYALWGGNVNANANVRYSGPSNDSGSLLNTCLGGISTTVLSNQYSNCDLNMNGVVRYSGPNNDSGFLLNTVLGGVSSTVITEQF